MKLKRWMLVLVAVSGFALGYSALALAHPGSNHYGYFDGEHDDMGDDVWPMWGGPGGCAGNGNALPWSVGSAPTPAGDAQQFIDFVICKHDNGNAREQVGAAFIMSTMTGIKNRNPGPGSATRNEFIQRVQYAASRNWINFNDSVNLSPNTYYQGISPGSNPVDVAFYSGAGVGPAISFSNGSNPRAYVIRRECANPLGSIAPLPDAPDFNMSGRTTVTNLTNAARGNKPYPGDTLRFSHFVRNNGPGSTSPTSIWAIAERTSPAPAGGVAGPGNFGAYGAGEEKNVYNHDVTVPAGTNPGTQFCERVGYDPVNGGGARDGRGVPACATVDYNFSLNPVITPYVRDVNGAETPSNMAEPGDTIRFNYSVTNSGTTLSRPVTCVYRQATYTGYSTTTPVAGFVPAGANCPPNRTFPRQSTNTTADETNITAVVNTSVCRNFSISPINQNGGNATTSTVCVHVASKPYVRAYGGDISAGGSLANSSGGCSMNTGAGIFGWNRRSGGAWAGAATQFAAYTMYRLFDTSTSLGNGGGSAPRPSGLAFANTGTDTANGRFGTSLGSVACIRDYYGAGPASPQSLPPAGGGRYNLDAVGSGEYERIGNTIFQVVGGYSYIDPNQKTTIYITGDVHIDTNIVYNGSWSSRSIPSLRIIVRGNVFINPGVRRIDGLIVAQPTNANDGIIYTCSGSTPFVAPANNTLVSACRNSLTVNGAFVARQVRLLRASGTLRQSSAGETAATSRAAEIFNYGPALWMMQPTEGGNADAYDSITSLPPVL